MRFTRIVGNDECYELACSSPVRDCKSAIVEKMAKVVNALSKQKTIGGTVTIIHESYNVDFAEIDRVSKRLKQTGLFKPNGIFIPHVDFTGLNHSIQRAIY